LSKTGGVQFVSGGGKKSGAETIIHRRGGGPPKNSKKRCHNAVSKGKVISILSGKKSGRIGVSFIRKKKDRLREVGVRFDA